MRVSVFGGTGYIGGEVITELVCRGIEMTVFGADHQHVSEAWVEAVQVLSGQLSDPVAVDTAAGANQCGDQRLGPAPAGDHRW